MVILWVFFRNLMTVLIIWSFPSGVQVWPKEKKLHLDTPSFLTAYLSYLYLSGYWKEMAGGASGSMKKITRTQVSDVKIPVPDIESQKKTVVEMQSTMDHYRQLEQSLESQLAEINRLPASLLREAFAGNVL